MTAAVKQRDRAYESFTAKLFSRDIRPGQFVSQRELVEITGMPLGAIREIVPRLEADGLIKTVPQRGMQIAHVDLDLIRNSFQFRMILEKEAIAHFVATAPDVLVDDIARDHTEVMAAAEASRPDKALIARAEATDWGLHYTIVDSLENAIISEAYRVNSIKVRIIRQEQTRLDAERIAPVMREHLDIITAVQARDVTRAIAALERHIDGARVRALRL